MGTAVTTNRTHTLLHTEQGGASRDAMDQSAYRTIHAIDCVISAWCGRTWRPHGKQLRDTRLRSEHVHLDKKLQKYGIVSGGTSVAGDITHAGSCRQVVWSREPSLDLRSLKHG